MKVRVDVDDALYKLLLKKMPWLSYESVEDFAQEAIRLRLEDLIEVLGHVQSSLE